jgi:hypothetical protein
MLTTKCDTIKLLARQQSASNIFTGIGVEKSILRMLGLMRYWTLNP